MQVVEILRVLAFCTNCGRELKDEHKFCPSCGTAAAGSEPTQTSEPEHTQERAANPPEPIAASAPEHMPDVASESPDALRQAGSPYMIDRKTLFEDGMLVMTSNDLILYSSDEQDELLRLPVSKIDSCGYSMMRRKLVVKRRVHKDDNLQQIIIQKDRDIADLVSKKEALIKSKRETRVKQERKKLENEINDTKKELGGLQKEKDALEKDPATIQQAMEECADTENVSFRLSDGSRDEYRIWEHVINRRIQGVERLKVESLPYGAVVLINGSPVGTTPITVDKPIVDDAILSGKYDVSILMEGHEAALHRVSVGCGGESTILHDNIRKIDVPDVDLDTQVSKLRANAPVLSIDLSQCGVMREVECSNEKLVLTSDALLVVSKLGDVLYYEIPYRAIADISYGGRLFGRLGTKHMRITYRELPYPNLNLELVLDDCEGTISEAELKRRGESVVELARAHRDDAETKTRSRIRRPSQHYVITEQDLNNDFRRFSPIDFETVIMKLFEKMGYNATVGPGRSDFGADVIARSGGETLVIQVKHWDGKVGGPDVHKTLGCMPTFSAQRAIVVTTSDFTNQAYEIQNLGSPVELWNGEKLKDKIRQYMLGQE